MFAHRKLRIGVVGCGQIAAAFHGPAIAEYANATGLIEPVVCCDLDADRARQFAAAFGFAHVDPSLENLVERHRLDAVCVFVSERAMADVACRLAASGVAMLLEKPPGRTVGELDRIVAATDAGAQYVAVAFNRRYMPLVRSLRELMAAVGEPVDHVQFQMIRSGRRDEDFSLTAVHGIDLVSTLCGNGYASAAFDYQPVRGEGPNVANIYMSARLEGGSFVQLAFCPMAGSTMERLCVQTRHHTFELNLPVWNSADAPGRLRHFERGVLRHDEAGVMRAEHEAYGFYAEDAAFFDAVRQAQTGNAMLRSARDSVAIAEAIRRRAVSYLAAPAAKLRTA